MAFIKGKDLRIKIGNKKVWHATECSISISTDTEEVATKDTNGKVVVPGDYGYTLSTSALVATLDVGNTTHVTSDQLIALQLAGTAVTWEFASAEVGTILYSGTAYITQSDITAATGSIANTSFSFTGSGDIAAEEVE